MVPYRLFYNGHDGPVVEGIRKGNPYENEQKKYQGFDIVITNIFQKPTLVIVNIDLIKSYFALDKHYDYPKIEFVRRVFMRFTGGGLLFTEGIIWKEKKNIISNVFNFEFIKS